MARPVATLPPWARRAISRVPTPLRRAATVAARTVVDALDDRVPGLAAEMAFYLILSVAPLLVAVFAGISLAEQVTGGLVGGSAIGEVQSQAETVVNALLGEDGGVQSVIGPLLARAAAESNSPASLLLSFGFLLTILSASRALRVTTVAITIAYDLQDHRPAWKQFLFGVGLTVAAVGVGIIAGPLLVVGPELGRLAVRWFNAPQALAEVWSVLYWPAAALVATLLLATLYHVAAPWRTPWRRDLPGAVLAMVIAMLGSVALRVYAARALGGDLFGSLAAPLVVLLWLYVLSFAVLLGAELNAEIERAMRRTTTGRESEDDLPLVRDASGERH